MSATWMPPLPEPSIASLEKIDNMLGYAATLSYSTAQVRQLQADAARAALEQAAKVCENRWPEMHKYWGEGQARAACQENADTIRRLAKEITP